MFFPFRHWKALPWSRLALVLAGFLLISAVTAGAVLADPGDSGNVTLGAAAAGQVQGLQGQANAVQAQIAAMDHDLEIAVEKHDASQTALDQLTMQLDDSRARLDDARARHAQEESIIDARLSAMYKAGNINVMNILLNSNSISDFFDQTLYIDKINEQDHKVEQDFKASADQIEVVTNGIDRERSQKLQLERQLNYQENDINARISERQSVLNSINSQVRQIIQQEAAREQAEQAQLQAEYASTLRSLQISNQLQAQVVATAMQYLGVPYVWGGESPKGFDCSGLTKYVFAQFGVDLPHNAAMQFQLGVPVSQDQLQPGDLVFWGPGNPHHVGLYIGKNEFIEAPDFDEVVRISPLTFDSDYAGARQYPLRAPGTEQ